MFGNKVILVGTTVVVSEVKNTIDVFKPNANCYNLFNLKES